MKREGWRKVCRTRSGAPARSGARVASRWSNGTMWIEGLRNIHVCIAQHRIVSIALLFSPILISLLHSTSCFFLAALSLSPQLNTRREAEARPRQESRHQLPRRHGAHEDRQRVARLSHRVGVLSCLSSSHLTSPHRDAFAIVGEEASKKAEAGRGKETITTREHRQSY